MLKEQEILNLISLGEGFSLELKRSVPSKVRELSEEVCAFANAGGGTILIGVNDDGKVVGASFSNAKRSAIQNSIREICPPLKCTLSVCLVEGKEVGVISVPSGKNKPYILSGAIFVRIGPNSQKLTLVEEMRDFFQQAGKIHFDEKPNYVFPGSEAFDMAVLTAFRSQAKLSEEIPDEQIFSNLQLRDDEHIFKNAAVLFFAKNPEFYFDKAVIRCVEFLGTDKRIILDDKVFSGPLYFQYLDSITWIKKKLVRGYEIEKAGTGPREDLWEIPPTVFREAIINALSHRDYYDKGGRITIEVFDDRVEVSNPGGLVNAISPEEFGSKSHSRNPLIFGLFERMRLVEQIGSGVSRMCNLMQTASLEAPVFKTAGIFTVVFRRPFAFGKWLERNWGELSKVRKLILNEIWGNPEISKPDLAAMVGLSPTGLDKNLSFLKKNGLLERIGTKGGKWKIHLKENEVKSLKFVHEIEVEGGKVGE